MTCGEKHALFWKKEGRCLVKKKGVFGRKATAQMLLCCSSLNGKVRIDHSLGCDPVCNNFVRLARRIAKNHSSDETKS